MRGFASQRQLPSAAVRTVATDLGDPSPSGCAKTITVSPARRVGTNPESRIPRPKTTWNAGAVSVTPTVVNEASAPRVVPASFRATRR